MLNIAAVGRKSIDFTQLCSYRNIELGSVMPFRNASLRFSSNIQARASAAHASLQHVVAESTSIPIRYGESMWNQKSLFNGSFYVPLTRKGIDEEAIEAGKRISSIPVDVIYTPALILAMMKAMAAMTQHREMEYIQLNQRVAQYKKR